MKKIKVFVLDDDFLNFLKVIRILGDPTGDLASGFEIDTIVTTLTAQALFEELSNNSQRNNILFLDGDLGEGQKKGEEHIEHIRELCPGIVIISFSMNSENRNLALKAGAHVAYSKENLDMSDAFWAMFNKIIEENF